MGTLLRNSIISEFARLKHDSDKNKQEPVFAEPWEAHAFAIAVKLSENGLLNWSEFSDTLAKKIKIVKEQRLSDSSNTYYHIWLSALETILFEKKILKKSDLKKSIKQWRSAYLSTKHGKTVILEKYK